MNAIKSFVIICMFVSISFCVFSCQKDQKENLSSKIGQSVTMIYSIGLKSDSIEYKIDGKQMAYFIDVFCKKTVSGQVLKGAPFMSFTFVEQSGSITKLHLLMIDKERFSLQGDVNDNFTYYGELKVEEVKDFIIKLDMIDNRLINEISSCSIFEHMPYSLIDFSKWKNKASCK